MKLNIIFAGLVLLCAVQANIATPVPEENDIIQWDSLGLKEVLEALKKIALDLAKEIKQVVQEPHEDFSSALDKALDAVMESMEKGVQELQKLADEVLQDQIENLPDKQLAKCIEKLEPKIKEVSDANTAALMDCGKAAKQKIVESAAEVDPLLKEVNELREALVNGVTKCIEDNKASLPEALKCVGRQLSEARTHLRPKVRQLLRLIAKKTLEAAKIVREAKQCAAKVQKDSANSMQGIAKEINECEESEGLFY